MCRIRVCRPCVRVSYSNDRDEVDDSRGCNFFSLGLTVLSPATCQRKMTARKEEGEGRRSDPAIHTSFWLLSEMGASNNTETAHLPMDMRTHSVEMHFLARPACSTPPTGNLTCFTLSLLFVMVGKYSPWSCWPTRLQRQSGGTGLFAHCGHLS